MRYLLDLHKKRDLKTEETDGSENWIRDLNMVIAQNALLARFTQKEGSENW